MYSTRLLRLFLLVKLSTALLALLSGLYLRPYLSNTELLLSTEPPSGRVDEGIRAVLAPFARWDSVYFLRIATAGYQFEQQHAFFPLFPLLIRCGALGLQRLCGLSTLAGALVSGVLLANICHFLFVANIYKLSLVLHSDPHFAFLAASFVVLAPAAPFLSAIYAESLFALLSSSGMIAFHQRQRLWAALLWSLASLTRSNGVVLGGFFLFELFDRALRRRLHVGMILRNACLVVISTAGYFAFQAFGYRIYCHGPLIRPWCSKALPDMYSFIQSHYWNVGLLKYYRVSQLPNFIIAAPLVFICVWGLSIALRRQLSQAFDRLAGPNKATFLGQAALLPHLGLLVFLLVYTLLVVHVQIIARLFSFQPAVYWILAELYTRGSPRRRRLITGYCLSCTLIGTVLFMNFYPPA